MHSGGGRRLLSGLSSAGPIRIRTIGQRVLTTETGSSSSSPSVLEVLKSRGLSPKSAQIVSEALKSASQLEEERMVLAKTLPISAFHQMEASMQDIFALKTPEDCEVRIRILNENGREFTLKGHKDESLLDLCKRGTELKDYLECACGGNMTCSTCHVYVKAPNEVGKAASPEEQDMIDLAFEPRENESRLGCQLKLKPTEKLLIEIPKQAFNYFK